MYDTGGGGGGGPLNVPHLQTLFIKKCPDVHASGTYRCADLEAVAIQTLQARKLTSGPAWSWVAGMAVMTLSCFCLILIYGFLPASA